MKSLSKCQLIYNVKVFQHAMTIMSLETKFENQNSQCALMSPQFFAIPHNKLKRS